MSAHSPPSPSPTRYFCTMSAHSPLPHSLVLYNKCTPPPPLPHSLVLYNECTQPPPPPPSPTFSSNQRISISRCPKSPFPSKLKIDKQTELLLYFVDRRSGCCCRFLKLHVCRHGTPVGHQELSKMERRAAHAISTEEIAAEINNGVMHTVRYIWKMLHLSNCNVFETHSFPVHARWHFAVVDAR